MSHRIYIGHIGSSNDAARDKSSKQSDRGFGKTDTKQMDCCLALM